MYGIYMHLPKIKTSRRPCAEGSTYLLEVDRSRSYLEGEANRRNANRLDLSIVFFVQDVDR
jgi:hypothetical protein